MKVHFSIFDAKVHFFFYTNELCCTGKSFIFKEQLSSIVMSIELIVITVPMIIKVGSPQYLFQKWSEFWYSAVLKLSFLSVWKYDFSLLCFYSIHNNLHAISSGYLGSTMFFHYFCSFEWLFTMGLFFFKGDMMTPVEESVLHRLHSYRPGAITRGKCVFPDSWAMAKGC